MDSLINLVKDYSYNFLNYLKGKEKFDYENLKNSFKVIQFTNSETNINKSAPNLYTGADMIKYKNITIRKRNDNRWYARIKQNNKYKYIYGRTQQECLNKLKTTLNQITYKKQETNEITLNQWLNQWYDIYKKGKISIGTEVIYKNLRNKYINKLGQFNISTITSLQIMQFLNTITAERQRQKVYTLLHDSFNKAFLNKVIQENPMLIVEKPTHEKKQNRAFSIDEQKAFVESCNKNPCGDYFLVTLFQGLRKSETFNIYSSDIDFENDTLSISQKEDKKFRIKTKASNRTLPLFKNTKAILEKYINTEGRIFKHSEKMIYTEFKNICNSANITNATIHTLRHTFITRCIENNTPLKVVQTWVGHTTSKMTNEVYTHINNEFQHKCKNEIDTLFDTLFNKKNKE